MITFNVVQCYFFHAHSYCAATLQLLMTVCSMTSGNLKSMALDGELFAAWIIIDSEDSYVIMTINAIIHPTTFLFNFGGGTGIGFLESEGG